MWILVLFIVILLLLVRTLFILWQIQRRQRSALPSSRRSKPIKTLIVLGSGGHTTEMLLLTKHLDPQRYHPIYYVKAATDTTSADRIPNSNATIFNIPRSREVGQTYWSSIFTTLYAAMYAFSLVARVRPGLILCNGPGTCVPLCVAGFVFHVMGWAESKIVFVESYCRVQTLSLTGKLLYYWADLFVVHWEELHRLYPRTETISTFVKQRHDDQKKSH